MNQNIWRHDVQHFSFVLWRGYSWTKFDKNRKSWFEILIILRFSYGPNLELLGKYNCRVIPAVETVQTVDTKYIGKNIDDTWILFPNSRFLDSGIFKRIYTYSVLKLISFFILWTGMFKTYELYYFIFLCFQLSFIVQQLLLVILPYD